MDWLLAIKVYFAISGIDRNEYSIIFEYEVSDETYNTFGKT